MMINEKLKALMTEKELKTLDDVRDFLKWNLTSEFINKRIFNSLNTTDKTWLSYVDDIKDVYKTDNDFREYCHEYCVETTGRWQRAYFIYCCLEYAGKRVLRELSDVTFARLTDRGITTDIALQRTLRNGVRLKDLGIIDTNDVDIVSRYFLSTWRLLPRTIDAKQLRWIYNRCCYGWYTMSEYIKADAMEYLRLRTVLNDVQTAEKLGLPADEYGEFGCRKREAMIGLRRSMLRNRFAQGDYLCVDSKGNTVFQNMLDLRGIDTSTADKKVLALLRLPSAGKIILREALLGTGIGGNHCISIDMFTGGVLNQLARQFPNNEYKITDMQSFMLLTELPEFIVKPIFDYIANATPEDLGFSNILL